MVRKLEINLRDHARMGLLFVLVSALLVFLFGCQVTYPQSRDISIQSESSTLPAHPSLTTNSELATHTRVPPTWDPTQIAFLETIWPPKETYWANRSSTFEIRKIACEEGFFLEGQDVVFSELSEEWSAFTCSPVFAEGGTDYSKRYTRVQSVDFAWSWNISHEGFLWSGRPNAFLSVFLWSRDGQYAYFRPRFEPNPSGVGNIGFLVDSHVLYRLDLFSGEFEHLLPDIGVDPYSYEISPDQKMIAYSHHNLPQMVYLRDLVTGEERTVNLKGNYEVTGAFVWTNDSRHVIFASALKGWDEGNSGVSVYKLGRQNLHLQPLLLGDKRCLVPYSDWFGSNGWIRDYWVHNNTLRLISLEAGADHYYDTFSIDINTSSITYPPTPTLLPTITQSPTSMQSSFPKIQYFNKSRQ